MVIVSRLTQQKGLPLMLHGIKVRWLALCYAMLCCAVSAAAC
jgi:hypothetical protein